MPPRLAPFPLRRITSRTSTKVLANATVLMADPSLLSWEYRLTDTALEVSAMVKARNRSPFKVSISWNGQNMRTSCTCPYKRVRYCTHRAAVAQLAHRLFSEATFEGLVAPRNLPPPPATPPTGPHGAATAPGTPSPVPASTAAEATAGQPGPVSPAQESRVPPECGLPTVQVAPVAPNQASSLSAHSASPAASPAQVPATPKDPLAGLLPPAPPTGKAPRGASLEVLNYLQSCEESRKPPVVAEVIAIGRRRRVAFDDLVKSIAPEKTPHAAVSLYASLRHHPAEAPDRLAKGTLVQFRTALDKVAKRLQDIRYRLDALHPVYQVDDNRPVPLLTLSAEGSSLSMELFFLYGKDRHRVPAAQTSGEHRLQTDRGTFVIQRDRYRETQAEWALLELKVPRGGPGRFVVSGHLLVAFVLEGIPQLEAKGWQLEGREVLAQLYEPPTPLTFRASVTPRIRWFSFQLEARAGGMAIPVKEVLAAWRARRRYLPLPGGKVAILPESWLEENHALIDAMQALPGEEDGGQQLSPCHVPLAQALLEHTDEKEVDPGFVCLESRLRQASQGIQTALPAGLQALLRPYQAAGVAWMRTLASSSLAGILADDMGLGKTLQVLTVLLAEKEAGSGKQSLVVAPTSVLENWRQEAARFTPGLRTLLFHGPGRHDSDTLDTADVIITSYALLRRDREFHATRLYHYVILDEAQAIKNPASETAEACRQLNAVHRLAMTGTPVENRLLELWSQFAFLMPELLGPEWYFQSRYVQSIEKEGNIPRQLELRQRVAPFIMRRLKQQVATDLPPLTESVLYCDLPPDQAAFYLATLKAAKERIFTALERDGLEKSRFAVLEALLRLRQICCHPPLSGLDPERKVRSSAKLELFQETMEEVISEGHRVLVFSQFVEMLQILRARLAPQKVSSLFLDGSTKDRQSLVDAFNGGKGQVFFISLKAGGAGLNLTGADYVIHYDPWWNPAVEDQATARAHRMGQTRPVFAYRLIARGTVEERMLELHAQKRGLVEGILDGERRGTTALSVDDLRVLFDEGI